MIKGRWRWRRGGLWLEGSQHGFWCAFRGFLGQEGCRILGFVPSGHDERPAERHPGAHGTAPGRGIHQLALLAAAGLHERLWSAAANSTGSKNSRGQAWAVNYCRSPSLWAQPGLPVYLLVQVLPCHGHVVGTLQGEDALEKLQGQGQVGLHVLDGVEGRAHAVRSSFVEV